MPTLKAIRRRISSVKSTQQITRAMKLVAASRLRRAQEALENSLPYSEALTRVADSVLGAQRATLGPAEGAANASFVVVISSDRGLCGGYNTNILKFAEQKSQELSARGLPPQFFVVGRKGVEHFKRTKAPMIGNSVNNPRLANVTLARDIAHRMLNAYQSGQAREIGIIYSHFRSAISQVPVYERLLPIAGTQGGRVKTRRRRQDGATHRVPGRTEPRAIDSAGHQNLHRGGGLPCAGRGRGELLRRADDLDG